LTETQIVGLALRLRSLDDDRLAELTGCVVAVLVSRFPTEDVAEMLKAMVAEAKG
jgi:hypothetical protein